MSAYVIVNVKVHNPETYKEYAKLSPISISAHGGRFLARAGKSEVLEGSAPANRMVVLEFPDYERAREWWNSEMYRMPKALRQSASEASMILVDGVQ
jgi:uncharacterized protein (DUF1330 family)